MQLLVGRKIFRKRRCIVLGDGMWVDCREGVKMHKKERLLGGGVIFEGYVLERN